MVKPEPAHNQTVEEILASIRQAISEDEVKRGFRTPRAAPAAEVARPSNVSHLFETSGGGDRDDDVEEDSVDGQAQKVIDLAIEKALDGVRAELEAGPMPPAENADERAEEEPAESMSRLPPQPEPRRALPPRSETRLQRPLMSTRAGAAVSASFDTLARSMATTTGIKLDEMVEGMLRPMLRSWLDDNLPTLVERLVREEIERVSRGRR